MKTKHLCTYSVHIRHLKYYFMKPQNTPAYNLCCIKIFPHSHKKNHLFRSKPHGELENAKMCIYAQRWQLTLKTLNMQKYTTNIAIWLPKGPFKYYIIMFLTFLGPPTQLFDDLQYYKSSRIAIFWPHPPTSLMT